MINLIYLFQFLSLFQRVESYWLDMLMKKIKESAGG
ncbi:hypothetical protein M2273_001448 [Mucilaginibacter lappiensis]